MNRNNFIVLDFETGSKCPYRTQITQIAAIAIGGRNLQVLGSFNSEVCPIFDDEKAIKSHLDPIQDEALQITHKTRAQLEQAPTIKSVWESFVKFVDKYSTGAGLWDKPIPVGQNITNFDMPIIYRMCQKYGPFDKDELRPKLFHPVIQYDIMYDTFRFTESNVSVRSLSLDSERERMGMSKDGAHNAFNDVVDCAELFIRYIKLYRNLAQKINFEKSCANRLLSVEHVKNI